MAEELLVSRELRELQDHKALKEQLESVQMALRRDAELAQFTVEQAEALYRTELLRVLARRLPAALRFLLPRGA